MKNIESLNNFYNTELITELKPLESIRKIILWSSAAVFILLMLTGILAYCDLKQLVSINHVFLMILSIVSLICISFLYYFINERYIKSFKHTVISKIINFINPDFKYQSENYVNSTHLLNSGLLEAIPNEYTGDDYVSGFIGETNIEFSELYIAQKYEKQTFEIFRGFFLIANFNKSFKGRTLVLPDRHEAFLGHFASIIQSTDNQNGQLVKLEDPEFERSFVVYSDDQVTSRYILTTSFMKRINDFKNKTGGDIFISFTNSIMYMAVPVDRNLFQPSFIGSILDYKKIELYYLVLALFIGVIEDFDLNTRLTY